MYNHNSMNPMLGLLNQSKGLSQQVNNLSQIKNMMNILRTANNPQAMLQMMIQKNPQLKSVMDYINQHGGNPQQAFYAMAKEKGVDPNEIIRILQE